MSSDIKFDMGRNISIETRLIRNAVFEHLKKTVGLQNTTTSPAMATVLSLKNTEVSQALKYFEKRGVVVVEQDKQVQTSLDGGRPAKSWKVVSLTVS